MTIKQIITDIIAKEGGYNNHPLDKGGPTKYGITRISYAEYFKRHYENIGADDIKAISKDLAEKIYYTLYYVRPNINKLPELIQPVILDMAVNHGRRGAIKMLQQTLLDDGYIFSQPDGIIGEKTIDAAEKAVTELGTHLIDNLINTRLDYYNNIISNDPSQSAFKNGWFARAESFRPEVA